jgi:hypothetical protein
VIRVIYNCRAPSVHMASKSIVCLPASRYPARLARCFFSRLDTRRILSYIRAGPIYHGLFCGDDGTDGYELAAGVRTGGGESGNNVKARRSLAADHLYIEIGIGICLLLLRIAIEIEIKIVYNMYRMRRFTTCTVCANCCLWPLPTMPFMNLQVRARPLNAQSNLSKGCWGVLLNPRGGCNAWLWRRAFRSVRTCRCSVQWRGELLCGI